MGPIATAASRIKWAHFCTLTYEGNFLGQTVGGQAAMIRLRMLWQWARKIEDAFGIPRGLLCFLARQERGEKTGRYHWHALIGGLHYVQGKGAVASPNPKSDTFILESLWKQCGKNAGFPEIREYVSHLSGVAYVMKGLEIAEWDHAGANAYELAKFCDESEARDLILAPRFVQLVDRCGSRNRRDRKARDVKKRSRDRSARGNSASGFVGPDRMSHPYDDKSSRLYI